MEGSDSEQEVGDQATNADSEEELGDQLTNANSEQEPGDQATNADFEQQVGQATNVYSEQELGNTNSEPELGDQVTDADSEEELADQAVNVTSGQELGDQATNADFQQQVGQAMSADSGQQLGDQAPGADSEQGLGDQTTNTNSKQKVGNQTMIADAVIKEKIKSISLEPRYIKEISVSGIKLWQLNINGEGFFISDQFVSSLMPYMTRAVCMQILERSDVTVPCKLIERKDHPKLFALLDSLPNTDHLKKADGVITGPVHLFPLKSALIVLQEYHQYDDIPYIEAEIECFNPEDPYWTGEVPEANVEEHEKKVLEKKEVIRLEREEKQREKFEAEAKEMDLLIEQAKKELEVKESGAS